MASRDRCTHTVWEREGGLDALSTGASVSPGQPGMVWERGVGPTTLVNVVLSHCFRSSLPRPSGESHLSTDSREVAHVGFPLIVRIPGGLGTCPQKSRCQQGTALPAEGDLKTAVTFLSFTVSSSRSSSRVWRGLDLLGSP